MMYLVEITTGQWEDTYYEKVFVTGDKKKADEWVERFNHIIEKYRGFSESYYDDGDWDKPQPFWYDYFRERPYASMEEVEKR